MSERAFLIDDDIQAIIEAWSLLKPGERAKILHFAHHPEELNNIIRFEEILITSLSDQTA